MKRYLDCNATCPPVQAALEAVAKAALEAPGNPSSLHWAGRAARRIVDDGRDQLAAFVGCESGSVVFTSGGTEANNIAIHSVLASLQSGSVVCTAIEHPAVLKPLSQLKGDCFEIIQVRPNSDGMVSAESMIAAITDDTRLVCMMMVNNESGAIQPVQEVAAFCRARGITMLVDAVQALGKSSLNFQQLDIDFMSLSAHKIGGPKGVGALLVRRGMKLHELTPGGGQERKRRSGTENVPGIAGFAAALGQIDFTTFAPIRDSFEQQLKNQIPTVRIISEQTARTANTSLFILPGMDGETLLMQLDLAGFAVASGSACSSGKREASHVLLAMGVNDATARSSVRVSFGPGNTMDDADALVKALVKSRQRLRGMAGLVTE
ncbi:MAG: cysteine desulfurase family protein [Mariprofundus sp.]|nr:cysteine desulfurase family protein [Mariprofundus sp.]